MINAKEAVSMAKEYFATMFEGYTVAEVLLEEVELSNDGNSWMVIYSFDWQPTSGTSSIGPGDRRFKLLTLNAENGDLISMKSTLRHE